MEKTGRGHQFELQLNELECKQHLARHEQQRWLKPEPVFEQPKAMLNPFRPPETRK